MLPSGAYSDANNDNSGVLQGTLSIGEGAGTTVSLTVHGYNDYATYGEISTLGEFELSAGTNTIKLALAGGRYTMDYMVLTPVTEDSGDETPTYFKVEGETYVDESGDNSGSYTPGGSDRAGVKIGETIGSASYAIWNVEVATAGTYTITTFGTGVLPSGAYSDANNDNSGVLQGTLSIGEGAGTTVSLTVHGYNDYATYGENSTLGEFELSAGTNTIKLALAGGRYTMDYMEFTPVTEGSGDDGGSGDATPTTITVEGETYNTSTAVNSGTYTNASHAGKAAVHLGSGSADEISSVTWSVTVDAAGTYTVKTVGTGAYGTDSSAVTGTLYIGETKAADAVTLTVHNGWNCFENALETTLGTVELAAGTHTIKLEINGGRYIMDYMVFTPTEAAGGDSGSGDGSEGTGSSVATVNGVEYDTFEAAFEAAGTSGTVSLSDDVELTEALEIASGSSVVLDLNGHTLTASTLAAFGGNVVDNSTDKSGVLKIAQDQLTLPATNSQMPVWNGTDGYVFATMKAQEVPSTTDGLFRLVFKPSFGTMFNKELFADGMEDNEVVVTVLLTWTDASGASKSQDFIYGEELIEKVYGETKAFLFSLTGFENVTDVTVTTMVTSRGVVWKGEPNTISGAVE